MNRIQVASSCLLASAFVLAGLLLTRVQDVSLLPKAHAGEVVSRGNLTLMAAKTKTGEESIFVLDNVSQKLLIYRIKLTGGRNAGKIDLAFKPIDLEQVFSGKSTTGGKTTGGVKNPPRP